MAAATQVFETAELLDMILLELPTRDLLLAQRVCKTWQSRIKEPKLQQALFFLSVHDTAYDIDMLLSQRLKFAVNPLLTPILPRFDFEMESGECLEEFLADCRYQSDDRRRDAWLLPDASWRRMLLTQPATKEVVVAFPSLHPSHVEEGMTGQDEVASKMRAWAAENAWCETSELWVGRGDTYAQSCEVNKNSLTLGEIIDDVNRLLLVVPSPGYAIVFHHLSFDQGGELMELTKNVDLKSLRRAQPEYRLAGTAYHDELPKADNCCCEWKCNQKQEFGSIL